MEIIYYQKQTNSDIIPNIVNRLQNHQIGIMPTDTIYGLVGIATEESVKKRIYEIKKRDFAKQLVLQISQNYRIENIVENVSKQARKLMQKFFPGALTLVFNCSKDFIAKYNWEIDTVAVRIPNHELLLKVLDKLNEPLFVTSSNISGETINNNLDFLKNQFANKVDFLVDDNQQYNEIPSTIVDVSTSEIVILREGVISKSQIMEILNNGK